MTGPTEPNHEGSAAETGREAASHPAVERLLRDLPDWPNGQVVLAYQTLRDVLMSWAGTLDRRKMTLINRQLLDMAETTIIATLRPVLEGVSADERRLKGEEFRAYLQAMEDACVEELQRRGYVLQGDNRFDPLLRRWDAETRAREPFDPEKHRARQAQGAAEMSDLELEQARRLNQHMLLDLDGKLDIDALSESDQMMFSLFRLFSEIVLEKIGVGEKTQQASESDRLAVQQELRQKAEISLEVLKEESLRRGFIIE